MLDINNISILSGITTENIRTFLPNILSTVRQYTQHSFITNVYIADNIKIKNGIITLNKDLPRDIINESQIELRCSKNNTQIYTIKNINNKTIQTYEKLFDEEFDGYIIKLSFNNVSNDIIASMINYKKSTIKQSGIKSENLGGFTYTLNIEPNNSTNGYPNYLLSGLNGLKCLPGNMEREYYDRGFIK